MNTVPLPPIRAAESCNAALPREIGHMLGDSLDAWCDSPGWQARTELAETFAVWLSPEPGVIQWTAARAAASRRLLTALLEQLGESEIAEPVQAALYLASMHGDWRLAAGRFIEMIPPHQLDAWMREHPVLVSFIVASAPPESAS